MAYWEFLLQKEGDHDWLPLETAHVEISEGRYRIIAHTSYCETPVAIHLSQLLTDQVPPKWKIRKRLGQTTQSGLMVVIPFTHLTAGRWTLKCTAVPPDTAASEATWEYGVQLQVLSIESGLDYWDADLEDSHTGHLPLPEGASAKDTQLQLPTHPDATETTLSSVPPPPAQSSEPPFFDQVSPKESPEASAASTVPSLEAAPIEDLPLRLQLQHQAIVAQQQTPLSLQGQVTTFSQVEGLSSEGTLWIQLRDPDTNAVVHREARSLSLTSVPSRFEVPISLPDQIPSRLLVGELSLWSATNPPQVLAIQGFTVTLNLDALLELVANQGEQSADTDFEDLATTPSPPKATETEATPVNSTANKGSLSLSPRDIPFQRIYLPSTGLTLPPVIYRPMDSKAMGAPSLPLLANQPSRRQSADTATPARPAKPLSLPPIGNAPSGRSRQRPATPTSPTPSSLDLPPLEQPPSVTPVTTNPPASPDTDTTVPATEPQDFQPDYQGRFWSRLRALAHEAQKSTADLKAQMEAAGIEVQTPTPPPIPADAPPINVASEAPINHEVVVYEEVDAIAPTTAIKAATANSQQPESLSTSDTEEDFGPIPVPQLSLPEGELIAGTLLPITVKLPLYPRRLAVKVWVTDIQSRSLADRPRWLMNWTPNSDGEQTALLQLQVPFGSLEAQFEAIAIDLTTQRESYKTTLVRSIVPPNLPEADLTELI
ncbi:MAG: hypothetical protein AAGE59_35685 [Cyanobacteria bacterium P01_F01_bin.86]